MTCNWKRLSQALAVVLVIAIAHVYVLAAPATSSASKSKLLFGRLSTLGSEKVSVNGSMVLSGTTILSDSQLQTPNKSSAIVDLGSAGKLEMAPATNLTLSFDQSSIRVNVLGGDALLTTNEGVKGSLTTADAKVQLTDGSSLASIGTAAYAADADPAAPATGKKCKVGKMPCWLFWTIVGGGGAAAIIIIAATRGNNPSRVR